MKTAVSIPEPIFESAEALSRRMRISRSRLYTNAIKSYMERHGDDEVTERLNQIYGQSSSKLDPALQSLQSRTLGGSW